MMIFKGSPQYLELEKPIGQTEIDYLILQLDSTCPHRCVYCFVGDNLNQTPEGGNLSLDTRLRVIKEASDLGARVVAMPGEGEPLATPGFKDIISYINEQGMVAIVYTKGYLLGPQMTEFLAENNATVAISLDSLDEKTAVELSPKPNYWFQMALINIDYARYVFKPLIETKGGNKVTRLLVNHMVNLVNHGQQEEIRDWCDGDMLFVCHAPSKEGYAADVWAKLAGDRHEELIAFANEVSCTKGNTTARADGKCAYYLNGITVADNGDIKTCPSSTKTRGKLGNVKKTTLRQLHEKTKRALREILGDNPPQCLVRSDDYGKVVSELGLG